MIARIPVRALLFVLYTVALLGGAFGISYAVFEWRDDENDAEPQVIEGGEDASTQTERNLTATEAAVWAKNELQSARLSECSPDSINCGVFAESLAIAADCDAEAFDGERGAWMMSCSGNIDGREFHVIVEVDDTTGRAKVLSPW